MLSLDPVMIANRGRMMNPVKSLRCSVQPAALALAALVLFGAAHPLAAQKADAESEAKPAAVPHYPSAGGALITPKSSQPQPVPAGHKFAAHTNLRLYVPYGLKPNELPPFSDYANETPASVACHYGLVTTAAAPACNPNSTTVNPTGGSKTIAIVDAFDDPDASGDLDWFSTQFGLPLTVAQFHVVWANTANSSCYGYEVPVDTTGSWELEESTDIEWAHAMAPSATIYLVEACSNYDSDLQQAVLVANNLVRCGKTEINSTTGALGTCPAGSTGTGEVSMSWGGEEFPAETRADNCANLDDSCFVTPGVVYFAAAGDGPGVGWPSASPNVVSSGGTTVRRNASTGNFEQEVAWVTSGGGQSAYETIPSYQSTIAGTVGAWRGVPDLSFDADPNTGVWVYDTFPMDGYYYQWWIVGGTSVSAPSLAGIVNRAGTFAASSNAELTKIYANKAVTADFTDITTGWCGAYMGFTVAAGWDFCTGVGVTNGYSGK